ncbi:hypothetical protein GUJ93_ZPchr0007g4061 [Zizania palustris]|uniref:ACT domain-containing protein ACR n=1 Tax=Zizania palustris TaxID=103762 RepID=A0A8J5VPL8_ZIZPA|nr:hypothetical protein GUJ93_ZPchr0007g4061 [Zizania palustris]
MGCFYTTIRPFLSRGNSQAQTLSKRSPPSATVTCRNEQSLGTWNEPARPATLEGLTALELTGGDRTGLISEVFVVLADMAYSVVEARAWTHHGRLGCLVFLRDEDVDAERMARIEASLGHLLRGDSSAGGTVSVRPCRRPRARRPPPPPALVRPP